MPFDLDGARKAGYNDDEIASFLAQGSPNFDVRGALGAGYSLDEIAGRLASPAPKKSAQEPLGPLTIGEQGEQFYKDKTGTPVPVDPAQHQIRDNQVYTRQPDSGYERILGVDIPKLPEAPSEIARVLSEGLGAGAVTRLPSAAAGVARAAQRIQGPPTTAVGTGTGHVILPSGNAAVDVEAALTGGARPGPRPELTAPTIEQIAADKRAGYRAAEASDFEVNPTYLNGRLQQILDTVTRRFGDTDATIQTRQTLERAIRDTSPPAPTQAQIWGAAPTPQVPVNARDIEGIRQRLGAIRPNNLGGTDQAAAIRAQSLLDRAVMSAPPGSFTGDIASWRQNIMRGRGNAATEFRMDVMDAAQRRAADLEGRGMRPETAYTGLDRPPISGRPSLLERERYTPAERAAVREIYNPTGRARRAVNFTSRNLGGRDIPTSILAAIGSAGATYAAGRGARFLGERLSNRQAQRAMDLVAQRSPLFRQQQADYQTALADYLAQLSMQPQRQAGSLRALQGLFPGFSEGLQQ